MSATDQRRGCVVVTGAGSGIGAAVAARYLDDGRAVVAADHPVPAERPAGLTEVGRSAPWLPVELDVTSKRQHEAAVETARQRFGSVDVLVSHAFIGVAEPFLPMAEESWDRVLDTNLKGAMLAVQSSVPHMPSGASIVILSSIAGRRYSSVMGAHYTVARYGLIGLARHLASELADRGIRINVVCPGPPNTPPLHSTTTVEQRERIVAGTPLRRLAEPEDVAAAVHFLTQPEARHIHGAVLDVNGGLY